MTEQARKLLKEWTRNGFTFRIWSTDVRGLQTIEASTPSGDFKSEMHISQQMIERARGDILQDAMRRLEDELFRHAWEAGLIGYYPLEYVRTLVPGDLLYILPPAQPQAERGWIAAVCVRAPREDEWEFARVHDASDDKQYAWFVINAVDLANGMRLGNYRIEKAPVK